MKYEFAEKKIYENKLAFIYASLKLCLTKEIFIQRDLPPEIRTYSITVTPLETKKRDSKRHGLSNFGHRSSRLVSLGLFITL